MLANQSVIVTDSLCGDAAEQPEVPFCNTVIPILVGAITTAVFVAARLSSYLRFSYAFVRTGEPPDGRAARDVRYFDVSVGVPPIRRTPDAVSASPYPLAIFSASCPA